MTQDYFVSICRLYSPQLMARAACMQFCGFTDREGPHLMKRKIVGPLSRISTTDQTKKSYASDGEERQTATLPSLIVPVRVRLAFGFVFRKSLEEEEY